MKTFEYRVLVTVPEGEEEYDYDVRVQRVGSGKIRAKSVAAFKMALIPASLELGTCLFNDVVDLDQMT